MNKLSTLFLCACLSLLILFSSCEIIQNTDEIITPEWAPEIAIPLVESEIPLQLLIEEAVPDELIASGPEEVITLVYQTEMLTIFGEDIFSIPDIPVPMLSKEVPIPFPIGNLNQLRLKSGTLVYQFTLSDERPVQITLSVPDLSGFGIPLERDLLVQGSGTYIDSVDLADYTVDLTDGTVSFLYEAMYTDDQSTLDLPGFQYTLRGLEQSFVDGHFGTIPISLGDDSTGLDISGEFLEAGFRLESPRLGMIFHNSMGIPVEIHASQLEVITEGAGTFSLLTDSLANGILLDYPLAHEIGETKTSGAYLTKDNSELPDALANNPVALDWNFGLTTHPSQDINEQGFLTDSSTFQIDLLAEVPMHGSLNSYQFEQEFEADLRELDRVSSASIFLVTENGLPIESYLQAYFIDGNGAILDSLFDQATPILLGPEITADGSVVAPAKSTIEVALVQDRIQSLLATEQIRLNITLGTTAGGQMPVKFYPENSLGIKLGIKGKLDF